MRLVLKSVMLHRPALHIEVTDETWNALQLVRLRLVDEPSCEAPVDAPQIETQRLSVVVPFHDPHGNALDDFPSEES